MIDLENLEDLRLEWGSLAEAVGNPFATWEWISTWWRHYGHDRPLMVGACRNGDGSLKAIVPLYLVELPTHVVNG